MLAFLLPQTLIFFACALFGAYILPYIWVGLLLSLGGVFATCMNIALLVAPFTARAKLEREYIVRYLELLLEAQPHSTNTLRVRVARPGVKIAR